MTPTNDMYGTMSSAMDTVDKTVDRITGNPEHREGPVANAIEEQTSKLPSDLFLWLAGGSILGSLTFKLLGKDEEANFMGQWAPTFLILGLYNKLVKVAGHDRTSGGLQ